jgi:hypothetical protein
MIFRCFSLWFSGILFYYFPLYCRLYDVCDCRLLDKLRRVWKDIFRALLVRSEDDHCQKSISLKHVGSPSHALLYNGITYKNSYLKRYPLLAFCIE